MNFPWSTGEHGPPSFKLIRHISLPPSPWSSFPFFLLFGSSLHLQLCLPPPASRSPTRLPAVPPARRSSSMPTTARDSSTRRLTTPARPIGTSLSSKEALNPTRSPSALRARSVRPKETMTLRPSSLLESPSGAVRPPLVRLSARLRRLVLCRPYCSAVATPAATVTSLARVDPRASARFSPTPRTQRRPPALGLDPDPVRDRFV
jgi:hypothetical protein